MKVRKQVYLDEDTEKNLKEFAVVLGKTETSIIREAIREYIGRKNREYKDKKNPLLKVIGLSEKGREDASSNHDEYLYQKDKD